MFLVRRRALVKINRSTHDKRSTVGCLKNAERLIIKE